MNNKNDKKSQIKKKIGFMNVALVGIFIFLFVFVCAMTYLTYKTSVEASTLIASVFAFCGIECGLMASIKKSKVSAETELSKIEASKSCVTNTSNQSTDTTSYNEKFSDETKSDSDGSDDDSYDVPIIY